MMLRKVAILFIFVFTTFSVLHAQPSKKEIKKATELVKEGDALYVQKKYLLSIEKYGQAIKVVPGFSKAYISKAYAHFYLEQYSLSNADLASALKIGAQPLEVYKLRWLNFYNLEDLKSALIDVDEALKIAPEDAFFNLAKADCHRKLKQYAEAAVAYANAARLDPKNPDTNFYLAEAYSVLRNYKGQAEAADLAIKSGTRFRAEAYVYLATGLSLQRNFEEAAKAYNFVLALKPDIVSSYLDLGNAYRLLNRYQDAISIADQGIAKFPDDGNLRSSLSWYHSLANNHDEAAKSAKEAIRLLPGQSAGFTNLCRANNDLQKYDNAIEACIGALKLSPNDGETLLYLARAYDKQKKTELANKTFERSISGLLAFTRDFPGDSDGFYLLGNAYYASKQRPKAVAAFLKCIELSPNYSRARYNLGYIYYLENEKSLALRQVEFLQKIDNALASKLSEAMKEN
jgi:tetratricopeptide (TPR) repeat protein